MSPCSKTSESKLEGSLALPTCVQGVLDVCKSGIDEGHFVKFRFGMGLIFM